MEIPEVTAKANEILTAWLNGETNKPHYLIRQLVYKYGIFENY